MILIALGISWALATEGIGTIVVDTTPFIEPMQLEIQVANQFWLDPTIQQNTQWTALEISDVAGQHVQLSHQLKEPWSMSASMTTFFVGSAEEVSIGNPILRTSYHGKWQHWNYRASIGAWWGTPSMLYRSHNLAWSYSGVLPNFSLQRNGHRGVLWMDGTLWVPQLKSVSPHVLLKWSPYTQKQSTWFFGMEQAWLENSYWSAAVIEWRRRIDPISISVEYRLPMEKDTDVLGAVIGLSVLYQPEGVQFSRDVDGDGVSNVLDVCATEAEDLDGFEDEDGCPDPDNDRDGIFDIEDQCPMYPEDVDGFEDADGCPDPDNDRDNILDVVDRCPNQPETRNRYQDNDGCPDQISSLDYDQDGLRDDLDRCPFHPEDVDGFEDLDGCPDPDVLQNIQLGHVESQSSDK